MNDAVVDVCGYDGAASFRSSFDLFTLLLDVAGVSGGRLDLHDCLVGQRLAPLAPERFT
jgi:hypothetical protein